ncbi:MAG: hypothetical protein CMJ18_24065 [Phycisphaeraceae bacterium]|nr:hypothetical protein [Phycisphaeraceae bacterium]
MAVSASAPEVLVWVDKPRLGLARRLLDLMGSSVSPVGIGGPPGAVRLPAVAAGSADGESAPASSDEAHAPTVSLEAGEGDDEQLHKLAEDLGCARGDDLRQMLVERPAAYLLLLTMDGVERAVVSEAVAEGTTVLGSEPLDDELQPPAGGGPDALIFLPAFDDAPGWTSAADPLDVVGVPRLLRFSGYGTRPGTSLYALLYDAWRMIVGVAGLPETVDASLTGAELAVPDDLRTMTGHMAVHARLESMRGRCAAMIDVSDHAGCERRELSVIGDAAHLVVDERRYVLYDAAHQVIDSSEEQGGAMSSIDLIAAQWRRLLSRHPDSRSAGVDESGLIACCQASLLSARTGASEDPDGLLRAHGRV